MPNKRAQRNSVTRLLYAKATIGNASILRTRCTFYPKFAGHLRRWKILKIVRILQGVIIIDEIKAKHSSK